MHFTPGFTTGGTVPDIRVVAAAGCAGVVWRFPLIEVLEGVPVMVVVGPWTILHVLLCLCDRGVWHVQLNLAKQHLCYRTVGTADSAAPRGEVNLEVAAAGVRVPGVRCPHRCCIVVDHQIAVGLHRSTWVTALP